jgi:hypothetical protein
MVNWDGFGNFKGIRSGDRVTYRTPQGQVKTGTAVGLLLFPDHVVINVGGKHGTPQVVDASNFVSVTHKEQH